MLLIGSHALLFHGIDTGRKPLDIDVIAHYDELTEMTERLRRQTRVRSIPLSSNKTVLKCADGRIYEVEIAWTGSSGHDLFGHIETVVGSKLTEVADMPAYVPTVSQLYTIKMSHRYLKNSPHFRKTRDDIMMLRKRGYMIFDPKWLKKREDETYWYKHPSLNVKKGDFFKGDGVEYVYDHDDIHKAMGIHVKRTCDYVHCSADYDHGFVPAYTLYMKDGAEVQCSKEKFFDVAEKVRLSGVLEEAQVLALERSQIPFRGKVEPRRSFDIALTKVCTSITSGWFREFAWENFDKVEQMYEPDYVDRFWAAVEAGKVRKLEPGETSSY